MLLFGVWKHGVCRVPVTYTPMFWSLVFPLGMYALASLRLSLAADFPPLRTISLAMAWLALAAWVATAAGLVVTSWRSFRELASGQVASGGVRRSPRSVVADVVPAHRLAQHSCSMVPSRRIRAAARRTGSPDWVGVARRSAEQAVLAEHLSPRRISQPIGGNSRLRLGRHVVDRQAALPGLGLAPRVVDDFGLLGQPVEVVPLRLERPDGVGLLVQEVG